MFETATGLFDNQTRHKVRGAATRFGFNGRPEDLAELKAAVEAAEAEIEEEKPRQSDAKPQGGGPASNESVGISQAEFEAVFGRALPKPDGVYAQRRAAMNGGTRTAAAPEEVALDPSEIYQRRAAAAGGA